jgi:hypothetical protein
MHVTQLAGGTIDGASQIELREPDDAPATIWIIWPSKPKHLRAQAAQHHLNAVTTISARASTRHAAMRADGGNDWTPWGVPCPSLVTHPHVSGPPSTTGVA